jgi:hypothetical protein
MTKQNRMCNLCKKASRRSVESLLCQDCADAISRVMACDIYEVNFCKDRQAQLAQARLLVKAARFWA